jgi:DNA-binding NtrC family response regulator
MAELVIVDDEQALLRSLQLELKRLGHECCAFETAEQAIHHLEDNSPDIAFFDIRLPDIDGLELIKRVKQDGHEFPIVVMTGFASISNAVNAMREGAVDYIEKPIDLEQFKLVIDRNLATAQLKGRLELLERTTPTDPSVEIIGRNEPFVHLIDVARRIAAPDVQRSADLPTILLLGETGTGKDLFARFIHQHSPAAREPFVQLNCAALPRELIESELFGHEKGAFTDAKSTKKGLLEIAANGTLFLDEIGELPLELQAKLLSALENRVFRRIGGTRNRDLSARFIAATNADLVARIKEGTFRDDLFYRLNVFTFSLPALRERMDDLDLLATHFLAQFARKYRKRVPELSPAALQRMSEYHWPGNIRELSHVLENVTLLSDTGQIKAHHLGLSSGEGGEVELPTKADPRFNILRDECTLGSVERLLIEQVMEYTSGNVSEAAKHLGLSRGALRRRLEHMSTGQ